MHVYESSTTSRNVISNVAGPVAPRVDSFTRPPVKIPPAPLPSPESAAYAPLTAKSIAVVPKPHPVRAETSTVKNEVRLTLSSGALRSLIVSVGVYPPSKV